MKRILPLLLCLALILCGATACKPDNITYPTEITDPDQNLPEDQPASQEKEEAPQEEQKEESPAPSQDGAHPFAAANFKFSADTKLSLPTGGFVKADAAEALKDRTITFYTAREEASFSYVNRKGRTITDQVWTTAVAKEYGFTAKVYVKSAETSLKTQRIALLAGKDISLLQLRAEDLASGYALARSAESLLDKSIATYGISTAVLEQSNHTFFAPQGYANALWYNKALLPEGTDPGALAKENKWTIDRFKAVYENAAQKSVMPLQMELLPWATLSGKNPLTLANGKLDQNLYAKDTREAFQKISALFTALPTFEANADTAYSLQAGNLAMSYTDLPAQSEKVAYGYAPLPALEEGKAGTVTFSGTFMALPKYRSDAEADSAALAFIELWCNRSTEARAAQLAKRGIKGEDYVNFISLAEQNGLLLLRDAEIETLVQPYLSGLFDSAVDMEKAYAEIKTNLSNLLTRFNLYY